MSARRAKRPFKPRREGDLTIVCITGYCFPWNGKAPVLLTPETSTTPLVPVFEDEQALRARRRGERAREAHRLREGC